MNTVIQGNFQICISVPLKILLRLSTKAERFRQVSKQAKKCTKKCLLICKSMCILKVCVFNALNIEIKSKVFVFNALNTEIKHKC